MTITISYTNNTAGESTTKNGCAIIARAENQRIMYGE